MERLTLVALTVAATTAALYTAGDAQTKPALQPPARPAVEQRCTAPNNPQVIVGNDRLSAHLADIDQNLAQIAYYLCLIESDMSRDKADK